MLTDNDTGELKRITSIIAIIGILFLVIVGFMVPGSVPVSQEFYNAVAIMTVVSIIASIVCRQYINSNVIAGVRIKFVQFYKQIKQFELDIYILYNSLEVCASSVPNI